MGIWAMSGGLGPLRKIWAAGLDEKLPKNFHGKLVLLNIKRSPNPSAFF